MFIDKPLLTFVVYLISMPLFRFSSIQSISLDDEMTRILTPQQPIDILRDVRAAKREHRPFKVVMVGVNGVGKVIFLCIFVCFALLFNAPASCPSNVKKLTNRLHRAQVWPRFRLGCNKTTTQF